jgi:hypothetical protein
MRLALLQVARLRLTRLGRARADMQLQQRGELLGLFHGDAEHHAGLPPGLI